MNKINLVLAVFCVISAPVNALEPVELTQFFNVPADTAPITLTYNGFIQSQFIVLDVDDSETEYTFDVTHFWNIINLEFGDHWELFSIIAPTFDNELHSIEVAYKTDLSDCLKMRIHGGRTFPSFGYDFNNNPVTKQFADFARMGRFMIIRDYGVLADFTYTPSDENELFVSLAVVNGEESLFERHPDFDDRADVYAFAQGTFWHNTLTIGGAIRQANKPAFNAFIAVRPTTWLYLDAEIFHSKIDAVTEWYAGIAIQPVNWCAMRGRYERNNTLIDEYQVSIGLDFFYSPHPLLNTITKINGVFTEEVQKFIIECNFTF